MHPAQLAVAVAEALPEPLEDGVELRVRRGVSDTLRDRDAAGDADAGTQPATTVSDSGASLSHNAPGSPRISRVTGTRHAFSRVVPSELSGRQVSVTASDAAVASHPGRAEKAGHAPDG